MTPWTRWNRFLFGRYSVLGLCLFRVCFGFLLLVMWALLYPDLLTWYGTHGVISLSHVEQGLPWLPVRFVLTTDLRVYVMFCAGVLGSFFLLIGFCSRLSAFAVFMALLSFQTRNPLLQRGADDLMRILSLYLVFAPAGAWLSVDAWMRRRKRGLRGFLGRIPNRKAWPIRLIQLQMSLLYASTFLAKCEGPTWWDGTSVYYVTRTWNLAKWTPPYILDHLWTLQAIGWYTLAIELALGFLIWFEKIRLPILIGGLILHLGISTSLNLPLWHPLMMSTYWVWLPHTVLVRLGGKIKTAP